MGRLANQTLSSHHFRFDPQPLSPVTDNDSEVETVCFSKSEEDICVDNNQQYLNRLASQFDSPQCENETPVQDALHLSDERDLSVHADVTFLLLVLGIFSAMSVRDGHTLSAVQTPPVLTKIFTSNVAT